MEIAILLSLLVISEIIWGPVSPRGRRNRPKIRVRQKGEVQQPKDGYERKKEKEYEEACIRAMVDYAEHFEKSVSRALFLFELCHAARCDDSQLPAYGDHEFIADVVYSCLIDKAETTQELHSTQIILETKQDRVDLVRKVWAQYQYPWPKNWIEREVYP